MKKVILILLIIFNMHVFASNVIPVGGDNNRFYYKIGGGSDFRLPPVSDTETVRLSTNTNLGIGYSCSEFNPALSITNTINDLKDSVDNLQQSVVSNATGSVIMMPMYLLASKNPALYNLINNGILSAREKLALSTKSCETVHNQISNGQNPYQDWATIAVNDQWKKKLSLAASGDADINQAKKEIDDHSGEDGVPWVTGKNSNYHAGGKNNGQPPIQVVSDTMKAGYNVMLNRSDLEDDSVPVKTDSNGELTRFFPRPSAAATWITSVVGDQVITTCNDDSCKKQQGSLVGQGLLPWVTSCKKDNTNCVTTVRDNLGKLVTGANAVTKDNLEQVSADGIAISPDVISAIHAMEPTQQGIIVNKLAQEIAVQRVIDKALMARNILTTGAQVPAIAANHPAQVVIDQAKIHLDDDIRSLAFERQVRKEMMSGTLSEIMNFSNQQQRNAANVASVQSYQPMMDNGALPMPKEKNK
jgi:integrating conjugative element protein (TIGR03755 family)